MKLPTAVAAGALGLLVGCSRKGDGGPPRVPVTVARVEQRAVPYEILATGTVEPLRTVSVQFQVTGVLTHVLFHEGDDVPARQTPFVRDPRPFLPVLWPDRGATARF